MLLNKMCEHFMKKGPMYYWDFRANNMNNDQAARILTCIEQNKTIYRL